MNALLGILILVSLLDPTADAKTLVEKAVEYWRGQSSYGEATMTITRPDWNRTMGFKAWSEGKDKTLVRFVAPAKDAGSATLTVNEEMWNFAPKINRVVKIPPSMMAQSWMGSDFSHNDLSKSADIIDQYSHKLLERNEVDGHTVYVIESIPLESAPVMWGKEILKVRDDYIILEHEFYDQDMKLVKKLVATEITEVGGRLYAKIVRMTNAEKPGEWTEVSHDQMKFDIKVPGSIFTLSNLSNPRE